MQTEERASTPQNYAPGKDMQARQFFFKISRVRDYCENGVVRVHLVDNILGQAEQELPGRSRDQLQAEGIHLGFLPSAELIEAYRRENPKFVKDDPVRTKSKDDHIYERIVRKAETYIGNKMPEEVAATFIRELARQYETSREEVFEIGKEHFPPLEAIQKIWARVVQSQPADEDSQLRFLKPKRDDEPRRPPILTTGSELAGQIGSRRPERKARDRAIETLQIETEWRNLSLERNNGKPFRRSENIEKCAKRIKRTHPDFSLEEVTRLGVKAEAVKLVEVSENRELQEQKLRKVITLLKGKNKGTTIPAEPERREDMETGKPPGIHYGMLEAMKQTLPLLDPKSRTAVYLSPMELSGKKSGAWRMTRILARLVAEKVYSRDAEGYRCLTTRVEVRKRSDSPEGEIVDLGELLGRKFKTEAPDHKQPAKPDRKVSAKRGLREGSAVAKLLEVLVKQGINAHEPRGVGFEKAGRELGWPIRKIYDNLYALKQKGLIVSVEGQGVLLRSSGQATPPSSARLTKKPRAAKRVEESDQLLVEIETAFEVADKALANLKGLSLKLVEMAKAGQEKLAAAAKIKELLNQL
ncbi:MAG: hypothetical protein HY398_02295 [Candidatus Doudnabacteria bacterium]|nr:hypothetical protein [Candidatus Doudnabacteria bacterium]